MDKPDSYIDRNLFNEGICGLIDEYLDNVEAYTNEVLAVQKKTKKLQLASENELNQEWDIYPIKRFLRKNEEGSGLEVDIDATLDLADSYFFLR
jgi:hypothetical protein